jgi:hypothetical protein
MDHTLLSSDVDWERLWVCVGDINYQKSVLLIKVNNPTTEGAYDARERTNQWNEIN